MYSNEHYVARFVSVLNVYGKYLLIPESKKELRQSENNIFFKLQRYLQLILEFCTWGHMPD